VEVGGPPLYPQEALYSSQEFEGLPVGVVMGLAWNPQGGAPVFVEAVATPVAFSDTGGSVQVVTGQLGEVMRESVNIAYTYARQFVRQLDPGNEFFKTHQLHLHCPEGAVGKDGPSAGNT
jgi:Lon-like ATP-dependent protease